VSSDWPVAVVLGAGVGSTREGGETLVLGGAVGAAVGAPVGLEDLAAGALDAAPGDDAAPPEGAPPVCANACPAKSDTVSANHIVRMSPRNALILHSIWRTHSGRSCSVRFGAGVC
jgi:hypothetical protein